MPADLRLGAIHSDLPAAVPPLGDRARLNFHVPLPEVDWHKSCPADGDAIGNDRFGCCVPAAELRAVQMRRSVAWKDIWKPDEADVLGLYAKLTGFDPTRGLPDDGTDTVSAMTSWCQSGIRLDVQDLDVVLWASVAPAQASHVKLAIGLLGPVQVTLALPLGAQDPASWRDAPGTGPEWEPASWGYHRVVSGKYDGDVFTVRSWGLDLALHPEFWSRYAARVDVTIAREWFTSTGLSPMGLDWDQLKADMGQLGVTLA